MTVFAFHQAIPGYLDRSGATLNVTLAVKGDQPAAVYLRTEPDNEELLCTMSAVRTEGGWTWYRAESNWAGHQDATLYAFKLVWPDRSCWLGAAGLSTAMPPLTDAFRVSRHHPVPGWVSAQVFYQIFPDRFHCGDDQLTPQTDQYAYLDGQATVRRTWGELPRAEQGGIEFFGGDLPGIVQKLDYLQQTLGVTALYLNPVFSSRSNHKYDTQDYGAVDAHLGGDAALADLSAQLHQRGMRLVLDAVFNHTSVFHPWFEAAQQNEPGARARYVFTGDQPTDYISWKGHSSLPVLDMAHLPNQHDLLTGDSAVIKHWLRPPYAIDGWRMDVIHMMGHGPGAANNADTVRTVRQAIKSENPEAYLLGEHFFEATSWLQGDQEDGAMNYYGFTHPVRAFLAGCDNRYDPVQLDARELEQWLTRARSRLPFAQQLAQLNQLDSHDTRRFITLLNGHQPRYRIALGLLLTYIGTPCLYYGNEIGLPGGDDPDCRRCFPWDESEWQADTLAFTQTWIRLRKQLPALQTGALVPLYAAGEVMVFARVLEHAQCLVAVNRGKACDIEVDDSLLPLSSDWQLQAGNGDLNRHDLGWTLSLAAESIVLWARSEN
ncbi:MAG TPA: maltodextrin glucosidase [Saccharospirillum sp.]|nr:maltodextrin glucosidase [Saccharospirillum sp.]